MNLEKSPYFKKDTYTQHVRCSYCGLLNIVEENMINCVIGTDRFQTLVWYTWCRACHKIVNLKETIYTLVQDRLIQRVNCFQSWHKCNDTNLYVTLDNFQEKCSEHKDCWLYLCKKCFTMIHVSKIHPEVRKRLDNKIKDKSDEEVTDEEVTENDPLIEKDAKHQ